jgi:uncharacterized protein (TIGR00299 family) protein
LSRVLYLDLVGGAAGDMILAALIDAGGRAEDVRATWAAVGLEDVEMRLSEAFPAGLRAKRAEVTVRGIISDQGPASADGFGSPSERGMRALPDQGPASPEHSHHHDEEYGDAGAHGEAQSSAHASVHGSSSAHAHRPYRLIRDRLGGAAFSARAKRIALDAFRLLAEAEAHVHGVAPEEVEFHEVGSDDAIADITGVAALVDSLAIDEVHCSPVPLGRGLTRGAHGPIPLPSPATLEILHGIPIEGTDLRGETVTPTGAALIRTLATRFGPGPAMVLETVGVGAGRRSWPDRPNIVRALVGRAAKENPLEGEEAIVESNIDDMSPAHLASLKRALFKAGAIDVWSQPIAMKKERTGTLVSALVRRSLCPIISDTFFAHSTTLGVRLHDVARIKSARRIEEVETPYGRVHVKIAERPGAPPLVAPEHDDCEGLAETAGVPLRAVTEAALRAAWARIRQT